MKVIVLNGSPKGDLSATMQSVKFMEKKFKTHEFKILNIAKIITSIEKNNKKFNGIIDEISSADALLWGTPVYVCLVPSQLMRFIELIWEKDAMDAFKGKYTAVLTTSIHFFDHCAHRYLCAICDDLDMNFAGGFSADSYDLLAENERNRLWLFAKGFFETISKQRPYAKRDFYQNKNTFSYIPKAGKPSCNLGSKKVVIITDGLNKTGNIRKMIDRFKACFMTDVEVIDLKADLDIKGGCLGCVQCGFDHECIYTGKDEYFETYNKRIKTADMLIFAGEIRKRFFSAKFKQFFDRSFFNNHTPTLTGKQIGFMVSGCLSLNENIREFIEGYVEWQGANLVDIITDEAQNSEKIDSLIGNFAARFIYMDAEGYVRPDTFLGVGGKKVFRDDIWGRHRFVFQADHEHFKKNGFYDFPQNDTRAIEANEFMFEMTSTPEGKEAVRKILAKEMIKPHQKKIDQE